MPRTIVKIITVLCLWGLFALAVLNVPYPNKLTDATFWQLGLFFTPLALALLLTINMLLKNSLISLLICLGLLSALILQGYQIFNFITATLIIVFEIILIRYIKKIQHKNLTKLPKIPKLTSLNTKK